MKDAAQTFEKKTDDVKKIMWWRNMKMTICLVIAGICLLAIIVLLFIKN